MRLSLLSAGSPLQLPQQGQPRLSYLYINLRVLASDEKKGGQLLQTSKHCSGLSFVDVHVDVDDWIHRLRKADLEFAQYLSTLKGFPLEVAYWLLIPRKELPQHGIRALQRLSRLRLSGSYHMSLIQSQQLQLGGLTRLCELELEVASVSDREVVEMADLSSLTNLTKLSIITSDIGWY